MIDRFLINSIYRATEGEGVFVGRPQIFVRFQGCSVGCVNCDSKDTWDFVSTHQQYETLNGILDEIQNQGANKGIKNISITGGDPLHPGHVPFVLELVKALKNEGFYINLEAAGTRVVDEIFERVDFISFDLKTPSTHVKTPVKLIEQLATKFPNKFQIKAVIEDRRDFDYALEAYQQFKGLHPKATESWVLTPSYNLQEAFPQARFAQVLHWNEEVDGPFRVIGQQHKWIFGPDKKQV